jgi:hypothetical protein
VLHCFPQVHRVASQIEQVASQARVPFVLQKKLYFGGLWYILMPLFQPEIHSEMIEYIIAFTSPIGKTCCGVVWKDMTLQFK